MSLPKLITFLLVYVNFQGIRPNDIESLECHFTNGLCSWTDKSGDWKIGYYNQSSFGQPFKPLQDGESFIFTQNNPITGQLVSPVLGKHVDQFCLYFNYYMFGLDVGQLSLDLIRINNVNGSSKVTRQVWKRVGSQYDDWIRGKYQYKSDSQSESYLQFVATSSNIAFGEINATPGLCDYDNSCDFEESMVSTSSSVSTSLKLTPCFWTIEPDEKSNYKWFISNGFNSEADFIRIDTTTETISGNYLRTPRIGIKGSKSLLITNINLSYNQAKCLSFSLYKSNQVSDVIQVHYLTGNATLSLPIWSSTSVNQIKQWTRVQINLDNYENRFRLVLSVHRVSSTSGSIAIDDLMVNPEKCTNLGSCNFDRTLCGYEITQGNILHGFGRLKDQTAIQFNPIKDGDTNDLFVYTNTVQSNEKMFYRLVSPQLPPTSASCLSFSYLFASNQIYDDNLFSIEIESQNLITKQIWSIKSLSTAWNRTEISLSSSAYFRINFKLTGFKLFGAIDDITVLDGGCKESSLSGQLILDEKFNNQSEFWKNSDYMNEWKFTKYEPELVKLPNTDPYDQSTGGFMYFTGHKNILIRATLSSSLIRAHSEVMCLSFWVWCSNSPISTLDVYTLQHQNNFEQLILSNDQCDKPLKWKLYESTFKVENDFSLQIVGQNYDGSIAIDELKLSNGSCEHKKVDYLSCKFDNDLENCVDIVPSPYLNWQITDSSELSSVTSGQLKSDGRILALDIPIVSPYNSSSYFFIDNLISYKSYCIQFSYLIASNAQLNIWTSVDPNLIYLEHITSFNYNLGSNWYETRVQINQVTSETRIVFGSSYFTNSTGTIGIDNLTIVQGECRSIHACDFTSSECAWFDVPKDEPLKVEELKTVYKASNSWIRKKSTPGTYQHQDSSQSTEYKIFLSNSNAQSGKAILSSQPVYVPKDENEICASLSVIQYSKASLEVLFQQHDGPIHLAGGLYNSNDEKWRTKNWTIKLNHQLSKLVKLYLVGEGDVSIDNLNIKMGKCPDEVNQCSWNSIDLQVEQDNMCGNCNFSDSLCSYKTSGANTWKVEDDYVKLSRRKGLNLDTQLGSLTSPILQPTSPSCHLKFSFKGVGTKRLIVSLLSDEIGYFEIWDSKLISKSTNSWFDVNIRLGRVPNPFQVQFTGELPFNFLNSPKLFLTGIKFIDCGYINSIDEPGELYTCLNGNNISKNHLCDHTFDCLHGDDETNCQTKVYTWEHDDNSDWTSQVRRYGAEWAIETSNGDILTAPSRDHTLGLPKGQFIMLNPASEPIWDSAYSSISTTLTGPELNETDGCSIIFYYLIPHPNFSLHLLVQNDSIEVPLKSFYSDEEFGFKKSHVILGKETIDPPFRFVLKGKQMDTFNQENLYYLAVDDIVIDLKCFADQSTSGKTTDSKSSFDDRGVQKDETKESLNCLENEFTCSDKTCLPMEDVCNYVNDCEDGLDEQNCGPCDFTESNLCGWTNEGEDIWMPIITFTNGKDELFAKKNAPETFIAPIRKSFDLDVAILKSPKLPVTSSECLFSFKYFIGNGTSLTVRVKKESDHIFNTFQELSGPEFQWYDGLLKLEALDDGHFIQFVTQSELPVSEDLIQAGLGLFELINCNPENKSTTYDFTTERQTTSDTDQTIRFTEQFSTSDNANISDFTTVSTEKSTESSMVTEVKQETESDHSPSSNDSMTTKSHFNTETLPLTSETKTPQTNMHTSQTTEILTSSTSGSTLVTSTSRSETFQTETESHDFSLSSSSSDEIKTTEITENYEKTETTQSLSSTTTITTLETDNTLKPTAISTIELSTPNTKFDTSTTQQIAKETQHDDNLDNATSVVAEQQMSRRLITFAESYGGLIVFLMGIMITMIILAFVYKKRRQQKNIYEPHRLIFDKIMEDKISKHSREKLNKSDSGINLKTFHGSGLDDSIRVISM